MKRFLLALDGSEHSQPAVEYAAHVLPRTDSEVILYHVHSRIPELYWDMEPKSGYDDWMSKLQQFEEDHLKTVKDLMEKSRQTLLRHRTPARRGRNRHRHRSAEWGRE